MRKTPENASVDIDTIPLSVDPDDPSVRRQRLRELFDREADLMPEVRHYYELIKIDYEHRVSEIETFLGFVEASADLGTRLHKLEKFVGIEG